MSRVTKFSGRDPGPAARVAGFMAHLRENGLRIGVAEADTALAALGEVEATYPDQACRALKAVCTGCKADVDLFDTLFDSYWMDAGRVRTKAIPKASPPSGEGVHSSRDAKGADTGSAGSSTAPETGQGEAESDGEGKLIATEVRNMMVGTSVQGRLLLISFNVTKEHEAHWLTTAKKILYSIRISE